MSEGDSKINLLKSVSQLSHFTHTRNLASFNKKKTCEKSALQSAENRKRNSSVNPELNGFFFLINRLHESFVVL